MNKASLQFHIEKNDLFGTLATVLDLVSQDLARRRYHRHAETLIELRDQLVYLQESHRIEKIVHGVKVRAKKGCARNYLSHSKPRAGFIKEQSASALTKLRVSAETRW